MIARYYDPSTGQEKSKTSKSWTTLADGERWLRDTVVRQDRNEWTDPALAQVPLSDWVQEWFATQKTTLKPKTYASYESLINSRIVPALGKYKLGQLGYIDVQAWVNDMTSEINPRTKKPLSPSRVRQAHIVLQLALQAAIRDNRITRNAAHGVRLPRLERKEAPYLSPEVVDQIAEAMPEPYDLFIAILGTLGPRFGEGAALRRRSVNILGRRLLISESLSEVGGELTFGTPKSHAQRSIPLPLSLVSRLEAHLDTIPEDPEALLFTSAQGRPVRYSNFRREMWHPTLKRLGIPAVGLHILRHSAAARMIAAGWSAKAVQMVLGHASAGFTLTFYAHIFDEDLDALADALDGDETGRTRAGSTSKVTKISQSGS